MNGGYRKPTSVTTAKWRLGRARFYGRATVRKFLLRKQNKLKRYKQAQARENGIIEDQKPVLWSDGRSSKFTAHVGMYSFEVQLKNECPTSALYRPSNTKEAWMIWKCFAGNCVEDLAKINVVYEKKRTVIL
ncbi:hypothetical protein Trydic_g16528 [Trypoxylus dichotomus]